MVEFILPAASRVKKRWLLPPLSPMAIEYVFFFMIYLILSAMKGEQWEQGAHIVAIMLKHVVPPICSQLFIVL
jgi:hypothetical protein